jgi:selenocysteine-specific elongation factor
MARDQAAAHGAATAPPSRVVATAGHVDHGKSTLVEWLTGTNPDRLEEERRRGLTIDLGFAATLLPSGIEVGLVDVPGHVRFLKNMVSGVGAVDACLFAVSAAEGWKPQSEDHLRILDLLGVSHGLVALTHAALVDDDTLALAREEVLDHVTGTFLEGARIVAVDVPAGGGTDGPDGLRAALDEMVRAVPPAVDRGRPRLWVDRSFAIRGAGAVVTGTLAGGTVSVGDHLELAPFGAEHDAPALAVRVRGLESYGRRIEVADPGRRLAANLVGVDRRSAARGAALVQPGRWHRCSVADATLTTLPRLGHAVSRRGAYLAHFGTGEQAVRLRVLGDGEVPPGSAGTVRLWLTAPLPLAPGDRYVLRDAGRREVVGGGTLLDVAPVLPVTRARPTGTVERVVAERGFVDAHELERLTGVPATPTLGPWVVDPATLAAAREALLDKVRAAGPSGLDLSLLDERERAVAGTLEALTVSHGIARTHDGDATGAGAGRGDAAAARDSAERDADLLDHPYLDALRAEPFMPPLPGRVDRNDLRRLVRSGLVVETNGVWFAASALGEAALRVAGLLEGAPQGIRVSDVRDALGASRKYVLALLAHFDATGVTRRDGDLRTAGPKMPAPGGETERSTT